MLSIRKIESQIPMSLLWRGLKVRGLAYQAARLAATKALVDRFESVLTKDPAPLRQISLKITNLCHLRCPMCAQWGMAGYNLGKSTIDLTRDQVTPEQYFRMIDSVAHLKPLYYVWGGEPFLYRGLMDVVGRMKARGSTVTLVTSGHKLAQNAERIVRDRWDIVMLSLDGDRGLHDRIRGREGTFDKLREGVDAVLEERERQGSPYPFLMTLSTVCEANAPHYDKIFHAIEEIGGIDLSVNYLSWFTTEERGRRHTEILEHRLGCTPTAWQGYLLNFGDYDIQNLVESVKRIQERRWPFLYAFIPNIGVEEIPQYYKEPGNFFGYDKCVSPWVVAEVMPDGGVAPCRDYPDYVCGNIKERPVLDVFHGERFDSFRSALRAEGMFPTCARCCGLMGM